jgi:hypothetical protein
MNRGLLARMALALTFVFALVATLIVVMAVVAFTPSSIAGDRCLGTRLLGVDPFTLRDRRTVRRGTEELTHGSTEGAHSTPENLSNASAAA